MPEQQPKDDGLVPPIKVLRKRVNGAYRADGLSGPTRRYVLIVAMLVGLASLPTLAVITAGSNEIDEGPTGAMDVPLFPLPSTGTAIPALPEPSIPATPEFPAGKPHRVRGQAGDRKTTPRPSTSNRKRVARHSAESRHGHRRDSSRIGGERDDHPLPPGSSLGSPAVPSSPSSPGSPAVPGSHSTPGGPSGHWLPGPADPEDVLSPPFCAKRQGSDGQGSDGQGSDGQGSDGQGSDGQGSDGQGSDGQGSDGQGSDEGFQGFRTNVSHRSSDRSEHRRRPTLTERPQNLRTARVLERTHNSRRHQAESRWDEAQQSSRSYRGSHRADRLRRADHIHWAARDRSSRVGRHHTDHQDARSGGSSVR